MDLPIDALQITTRIFLILFIIGGAAILAISYFHAKEARKMERKLEIELPGSVHIVLAFQLLASILYVALCAIFLFLI